MVRVLVTIAVLVCFCLAPSVEASLTGRTLAGVITDTSKQPVVGATVTVIADGKAISGAATNQSGEFTFRLENAPSSLALRVSSIGYAERERTVELRDSLTFVRIECIPQTVQLSAITVFPARELDLGKISIPSERIALLSGRSLVMTNPIAAIQYPQLGKIGSSHSSQIRINGTSPAFYLNGISIGSDPNHYGMFSLVPGSIVDQIDFQPQGTDASFGVPSAIDLKSASSFGNVSEQELNISTLEVTGSLKKSTTSHYVVGAVRKSVLDALVNSFDISSQRQTIPPTSFSDIYLSTGVKLSPRYQLALDQYHAYDYLAFNTAATTKASSSVQTYQRARENYVGLRLQGIYERMLVDATLAVRDGSRAYQATPDEKDSHTGVQIDLTERQRTYVGSAHADIELGSWRIKTGNQIEFVQDRATDLTQHNWNFLPPFATSDNPYIFQVALNTLYGTYHGRLSQLTNSSYLSATRSLGPVSLSGGIRSTYYQHLAAGSPPLGRFSATVRLGEMSRMTLFCGSFSEDPIAAVLEPYQVLIRNFAGELRPVSTKLLSLDYIYGPVELDVFTKKLSNMPVISPDFDFEYTGRASVTDRLLSMRSAGSAQFYGGSVACDIKQLFHSRLSFYGSYAYTHAVRTEHEITFPYETSAPHRLTSQLEYKMSRKVTVGSDVQVRSGYRYSPPRSVLAYSEGTVYNEAYYQKVLSRENSMQFAANMALNLYANFDFGNLSLHLAVTNATNRYNQIIKSPSGYVYDTGILPSLGLRWKL